MSVLTKASDNYAYRQRVNQLHRMIYTNRHLYIKYKVVDTIDRDLVRMMKYLGVGVITHNSSLKTVYRYPDVPFHTLREEISVYRCGVL